MVPTLAEINNEEGSNMSYLRNAWYLAAWDYEVRDKPLGRLIAEQPIVIFRQSNGELCATGDRCPHRFAPLHMGKVVGDAIECPYHGLRFGAGGQCVHNPHGDGRISSRAKVPGYSIVERHRGVWIWLGNQERADVALIPDYSIVDSAPDTAVVQDYLRAEANYQLLTDNVLDLTHADYVHAGSLGNGGVTKTLPKVWEEDDAIFAHWWIANDMAVPSLANELPDPEAPTDQWLEVKWNAPGNMSLRVGATPTGRPREEGIDSTSLHIMTPETANSTHYFFANARQFRVDDPAINEVLKGIIANQFLGEDKPILEAQQKMMGTTDLFDLKPVFLPQDAAAVRARRKLDAMCAEENQ